MMKRILSHILIAALVLCGTLSCMKDLCQDGKDLYDDTPGVHLFFSLGESSPVKAGNAGTMNGTTNENVINSIDYFLYVEGATGSNAMVHDHVNAENLSIGTSRDGTTAVQVPTYSVNVGEAMMKTLFSGGANGNQCEVYIIANYPGEIDHSGNTSFPYLQSLVVSSTFKDTTPTQFVMDGLGTATMIDRTKIDAAEGIINMERIATKITLEVHCVSSVEVVNTITSGEGDQAETYQDTVLWYPMLSGMKANLCMGKQSGKISGEEAISAPTFKYTKTDMTRGANDTTYLSIPFYSFPRTWHHGDEDEPYIKLELPWRDASNQKQFYYKIPLAGQVLEKNNWYHIVLNVAIIGGEDFEAGVTVTGQYYVVPWETHVIINAEAEIVEARYLTVPRNEYTLYNENTLSIPFVSSHDCKIRNITFTRPNTKNNPVTTDTYINQTDTSVSVNLGAAGGSLAIDDRTITFTHNLLNDISQSSYDTSPYTLTFTICHEDALVEYSEDITVTQVPSMSIDVKPNSDANSTVDNNGHTTEDGFVFINGTRTNTDQNSNRLNRNFNMYVISTSVLPSTGQLSDYMLGDPRQVEYDNSLGSADNSWSVTAGYVGGDNSTRRLSYYRPAGEDVSFDNVIAPTFRIASSFGATTTLNRTEALQRCASYQEDGYPAGRWRLPTVAEIVFMAKLTTDKVIPRLLGSDNDGETSNYWCNSGYAIVYDGSSTTPPQSSHSYNNSTTCSVRCVYDEWFWSKSDYPTVNKTIYTWGDQDI